MSQSSYRMGVALIYVYVVLFTTTLAIQSSYDACTSCEKGEQPERDKDGYCSCKSCPEKTYKIQENDKQCTECTVVDQCDNGMNLLYPCDVTEGDGKCSVCKNKEDTKYAEVDEECLPCGGVCGEGHSFLPDCRRQGYKPGMDCEFNDLPTPKPETDKTKIIGPIVATVLGVLLVLAIVAFLWIRRERLSRAAEESTPSQQVLLAGEDGQPLENRSDHANRPEHDRPGVDVMGVSGGGSPSSVDAEAQREEDRVSHNAPQPVPQQNGAAAVSQQQANNNQPQQNGAAAVSQQPANNNQPQQNGAATASQQQPNNNEQQQNGAAAAAAAAAPQHDDSAWTIPLVVQDKKEGSH